MNSTEIGHVIHWLLEGDPAIRWQTLRDVLGAPENEWKTEQARALETGWGAKLLAFQEANGGWGGGVYTPKWTSTTYTLLTLCNIGIPRHCAAAQRGARVALEMLLGAERDSQFQRKLAHLDRCIVGMLLQIGVYFGIDDERIEAMVENLLNERMPDSGWNCRRAHKPVPHHSSFHTTFNVLEGLREYIEQGRGARLDEARVAEQGALEFMLQHRLYKSDKTGQVINSQFMLLSFPYRWHYDVLRGLEYFARANALRDARLQEAVNLLYERRRKDGYWPLQHKYPGKTFFEMEKSGRPSRWNTLRALRVLRWWESG